MSRSNCPKCQGQMKHVSHDGLPTTACGQCAGTWVDIPELEHLAYGVAAAHELVEVFTALAAQELAEAGHACPGCSKPLLLAEYGGVEVDLCRSCKGLYLDRFELASVLDPRATSGCPKCASPMRAEELRGVPTSACPGCGGRWLAVPVLEHLQDPSRTARLASQALIRTFASVRGGDTRPTVHRCPTCHGSLVACDHRGIELDLCFKCRGLFLDQGEIEEVTAVYSTASERAVAAMTAGPGKALDALVSAVGSLLS